ncbi:hypothetical protein CGMCC3_g17034 [Colletotrichum fructicola]|nr:uncharacterized protein CGMCC3_g17034 [Colletotrichum fructicola]KAE9566808.1 hypothetical protein CGMCC3_g17034 [Colletotrichum fructicola]
MAIRPPSEEIAFEDDMISLEAHSLAQAASEQPNQQAMLLADARDGEPGEAEIEDGLHHTGAALWRPQWLQPAVLSSFMVLFLLGAIILPIMRWLSLNNDGLVQVQANLVYLWRFGPTAVITLGCIMWSRVELQTLRYTPWNHVFPEQQYIKAHMSFDIDYTSMLSPVVLFTSLRRKHYLVLLVSVTSAFLKIQAALAPGLFSLSIVNATQSVDVRILDSFNTAVSFETEFLNTPLNLSNTAYKRTSIS